jgi:hypothetical protein
VIVPAGTFVDAEGLTIPGRNTSGWAEVYSQNFSHLLQHFADSAAPASPVRGMLWYDLSASLLKIWDGATWAVINSTVFAPASSSRVAFSASADTPVTITHNLGAPAPYLVMAQFFVDTGGGVYKQIVPSDESYVDANTMTVTFSGAYSGYALTRL